MQNDIFSTVTEATKMENLYLAPMTLTQLGELYDESKATFARRMVEHSWFWGKIFANAKRQAVRGQWLDWLRDRDVSPSTAQRLMRLYKGYPQILQLGVFGSDDEGTQSPCAKARAKAD